MNLRTLAAIAVILSAVGWLTISYGSPDSNTDDPSQLFAQML
jgi:hypothetical protein